MTAELNFLLERYLPSIEAGEASNKIDAIPLRLILPVSRAKAETVAIYLTETQGSIIQKAWHASCKFSVDGNLV